mmetsp:Transcript_28453/g.42208  ORF Transcript_28453/g.42208 Transcript_28453/m.42208 type:complete len:119 (-) Transcript_28453:2769-3125(-)
MPLEFFVFWVLSEKTEPPEENERGGSLDFSCSTENASRYKSLGRIPFMNKHARYEKPKKPSKKNKPMKHRQSIIIPKNGFAIFPGSGAVNLLETSTSGRSQSKALARTCAPALYTSGG